MAGLHEPSSIRLLVFSVRPPSQFAPALLFARMLLRSASVPPSRRISAPIVAPLPENVAWLMVVLAPSIASPPPLSALLLAKVLLAIWVVLASTHTAPPLIPAVLERKVLCSMVSVPPPEKIAPPD